MNTELLFANVQAWWLQAAVLVGVGMALPLLFRARSPRWRLAYLQAVLAACLLLPLVQPVERPVLRVTQVVPGRIALPQSALQFVNVPTTVEAVNWRRLALLILGAGVVLRLGWLAIGMIRLRQYRQDAQVIDTYLNIPVAASIWVESPVTFGYLRPVILVPYRWMDLKWEVRAAALRHESVHVRRGDWLFALAEEITLCLLWFHPAAWILIDRIRLTREQVVDIEAAAGTQSETYVEALVSLAEQRLPPPLAAAPSFLRRRHLYARIKALVEERSLSIPRLAASYSLAAMLCCGVIFYTGSLFPLRGQPQVVESLPTNVHVDGAQAIWFPMPAYPPLARQNRIEGPVVLEVSIAANGEVADARVISGPEELRRAALDGVLDWQFEAKQAVARVTIDFRIPPDRSPASVSVPVSGIEIDGKLDPKLVETLRARLQPLVGQPFGPWTMSDAIRITRSVLPSLQVQPKFSMKSGEPDMPPVPADVVLIVTAQQLTAPPHAFPPSSNPRIRVGGAVQAGNLLQIHQPEYPPLARQARIQGVVRFDALIGTGGTVQHIRVVSGHPLLIPNATDAVRRFVYKPTYVDGKPVEVQTQVDVNFTL